MPPGPPSLVESDAAEQGPRTLAGERHRRVASRRSSSAVSVRSARRNRSAYAKDFRPRPAAPA